MKKIAITGGIGSGKSTAAAFIKAQGYPVFSCDEIYREVLLDSAYIDKMKTAFPSCIIDGKIDRMRLGAIIFNDKEKRAQLDRLAHPFIMKRLLKQMNSASSELVFAEVPLLLEGGFEGDFDGVIVIMRTLEQRIAAIKQRNNLSDDEILARIKAQFDYNSETAQAYFKKIGAIVIENNADEKALESAMKAIVKHFS